jgi:hypothetical protein
MLAGCLRVDLGRPTCKVEKQNLPLTRMPLTFAMSPLWVLCLKPAQALKEVLSFSDTTGLSTAANLALRNGQVILQWHWQSLADVTDSNKGLAPAAGRPESSFKLLSLRFAFSFTPGTNML